MQRGEFYYYFSTMGGGKSLELILDDYRSRHRGRTTAIIKPEIDKKAGSNVETRFGQTRRKADLLLSHDTKKSSQELLDLIASCTIKGKPVTIYLDEVQFLTKDHVMMLREVVDDNSVTVKAYGLLTDFTGRLFEASKQFIEVADHKIQIASHCEINTCDRIAVYNARIADGKATTEGPTVAIDGIDAEYKALCSSHFMQSIGQ